MRRAETARPKPGPWQDPLRLAGMRLWTERVALAHGPAPGPSRSSGAADLRARGVLGRPPVLRTGALSPGCRNCLAGRGACLSLTHRCTRSCFFCPNPVPRRDRVELDRTAVDARSLLRRVREAKLGGLGISGGEPLLRASRALRLLRLLRETFGPSFYLHLYSNGDLADAAMLRRLADAGLDEIRFDLAANGYDASPVRRAVGIIPRVGVECPVIPGMLDRLKRLALELDAGGADFWNLQELYSCRANLDAVSRRPFSRKERWEPVLTARHPVAGSEEEALDLLKFAARRCRRLSVFYCSCDTKEHLIAPRSYAWRGGT